MEVFLRNLPIDASEDILGDQLKPLITGLGIKETGFKCRKVRRQRIGTILFARRNDGRTFLNRYGDVPVLGPNLQPLIGRDGKPKVRSRLQFMGTRIYCEQSRKPANSLDVKSLSYHEKQHQEQREWEARHTEIREHATSGRDGPVSFELWKLRCGHLVYPSDNLHFHPDLSWEQPRHKANAKFAKSTLIITLSDNTRFDIPYNIIHELIASTTDYSLTLILEEPPRLYKCTRLPQGLMRERLTSYGLPHQHIIGVSLVYRLETSPADFIQTLSKLYRKAYLAEVIAKEYLPCVDHFELNRAKSMHQWMLDLEKMLSEELASRKLGFDVLFQLQSLAWNAYLLPETVIELARVLRNRAGTSKAISALTLKRLFPDISFPSPSTPGKELQVDSLIDYLDDLQQLIAGQIAEEEKMLRENPNLTRIYKATVTPTHVTLHGPEIENQNRILRKFPKNHDHFIRIQFADEDGQDVRYSTKVNLNEVFDRFKSILAQKGISIGGRNYGFFGFSHSSLRSHSAWFLAPFTYESTLHFYDKLIKDLGDFSKIPIVAKCAARIGQAFSETPFAVKMRENGIQYRYIEDVKSADGSRCFSDGVGKISVEAVYKIWDSLPGNRSAATVFQIRFGGCKGLLALDSTIEGNQICIRKESMEKFESNDKENLEICDMASKPIPLYLNRQNIKILEDMGVGAEWFFHHQGLALDALRGVAKSVVNSAIFMQQHAVGDNIEFPKFLRRLDKLGLDYRTDSLLSSIVETVVFRELRLLKNKARIPVREGVTLFGIMDETGFLNENEVFVTYTSRDAAKHSLPPQDNVPVIVTRSPALHPGDIQIAMNRVPPNGHPLSALNNCVVFNHKGDRDLPSMLSGGDLDGDLYNVIWDRKIFNYDIETFRPADYGRPDPLDIGRTVTREDMANFFVDFMKTDQLGLIATRHMILADQMEEGTLHPNCQILAELHSAAVDFSKTGIPADVKVLSTIRVHKSRPDFLAPGRPAELLNRSEIVFEADPPPFGEALDEEDGAVRFEYYESDNVLGMLYRAIDEHDIWHKSVKSREKRDKGRMWEILKRKIHQASDEYSLKWTHHKDKAQQIRRIYDEGMQTTMIENGETAHKPLTEVEVFTGQILNPRGALTRRQKDRSEHLKEAFNRISGLTWKMIRDRPQESRIDIDTMSEVSGYSNLRAMRSLNKGDKDALELSLACFNISMQAGGRIGRHYNNNSDGAWQVETFRIIAANVFLKELEMYKTSIIAQAATVSSGGYVGVNSGPSWRHAGPRGVVNDNRASSVVSAARTDRGIKANTKVKMENREGSRTSSVAASSRNGVGGAGTSVLYQQIRGSGEITPIVLPLGGLALNADAPNLKSKPAPPVPTNSVRPFPEYQPNGAEAGGGVRLC